MRDVIHAVDEGDLLIVAFHSDILSIHDERASEAFPVAVPGGDIVIMRQSIQFLLHPCVRRVQPSSDAGGQRADACAFEVEV